MDLKKKPYPRTHSFESVLTSVKLSGAALEGCNEHMGNTRGKTQTNSRSAVSIETNLARNKIPRLSSYF